MHERRDERKRGRRERREKVVSEVVGREVVLSEAREKVKTVKARVTRALENL